MGGRLLEGPTVAGRTSDWKEELGYFLKPFLDRLGHKARRQMCPLYVSGLIGPGDRKSVQPMAKRLALGAAYRRPLFRCSTIPTFFQIRRAVKAASGFH